MATLTGVAPVPTLFDGETYEPERDRGRLAEQARRVWHLMSDEQGRTLHEIACKTGDPEASVSARLRDFRKPRWGSNIVHRKSLGGGVFEYRLERRV